MVICWERADLLALVGDVYCIFVTIPCHILGQVRYLIVSFPDLCRLSYFHLRFHFYKFTQIVRCSYNALKTRLFQKITSQISETLNKMRCAKELHYLNYRSQEREQLLNAKHLTCEM